MSITQRGVIGVMVLLAMARFTGLSSVVDTRLTDTHWRWSAQLRPSHASNLLIVAIDDKTVRSFGRLKYWSRGRYADLLDRLGQSRAVLLDILFTEPDRLDPAGDARLAKAIKANGRTVIPAYEWRDIRPLSNSEITTLEALKGFQFAPESLPQGPPPAPPFISPLLLELPLPSLIDSAASVGTAVVNADPDGVYRAPVVLKTANGRLIPHVSLALACLASRTNLAQCITHKGLLIDGRTIPLDNGAVTLQPVYRSRQSPAGERGPRPETISFVDALKQQPEFFKDKIVLIGETATGTADIRPNPLDPGLRGVELNAEILENLLYLPPVRVMPAGAAWLLVIIAAGIPLALYARAKSNVANIGAAGALVGIVAAMETMFWVLRIIPPWSTVLLAFAGATLLMAVQRYAQEEAMKRRIRDSFSVYVAPEVVEEIVDDPEIAHQDGKRREVAVLFSDIRGFTTYCEQHPPEFVVEQMREYLDEMSAAVDASGGVLDKYIGDAVMALFGPFLTDGNKSALAVVCAISMVKRLEALNARWKTEDRPQFKIGIGIHTGEAIVGNIGSTRRMQYTALGDTVNIASRLESMTKEASATILVSEPAKAEAEPALQGKVEFRQLGELEIRGRQEAVAVYEAKMPEEKR